ncbi:MAG: T9SS type A sorting domain-containing protein [Saprospiraceae bacterium]|nr:T9SS type A sorting domain-containing protein [Saprospiraceae bacterium]
MKKRILFLITLAILQFSIKSISQIPSYVPKDGLVGWWPFNTNAIDVSGNGNNGIVNNVKLTNDRFGNSNSAYDFDGIKSYIHVNKNFDFIERSFSFWFNASSLNNTTQIIIGHDNPSLNFGFTIAAINTDNNLYLQSGFPAILGVNSIKIKNSQWYHVVISRNAHTTYYYVNSVLIYTQQNKNGSSDYASLKGITIGTTRNLDRFFDGQIDDLGVWNRALSLCEISDLYHAQLGSLSTITETSISSCGSYIWPVNNQFYNSSGTYTITSTNEAGCFSQEVLYLSINYPTAKTEVVIACDSFEWINGITYFESTNIPSYILTNSHGCDSIVTLNLTISSTEIKSQPVSQTTIINNNAVFFVTTLSNFVTYQWQIDSGNGFQNISDTGQYSGTTTNTLNVSNVTINNNNQRFRCIINNGLCSITSDIAVLTVDFNIGTYDFCQDNLFSVYPNPTINHINIRTETALLGSTYYIFDYIGKLILTGNINSRHTIIEMSNLSSGIYLFNLDKQTCKVLKQ